MKNSGEIVTVYRACELEAQVIKGLLESAGIPVFLKYESLGRIYGITVDGLGEVQVVVSKEDEEAARALIKGRGNG